PAMRAAAGGAAPEAGVAHPHHPADDDQREGGEDGRVEQAAEASELVRFATRGEAVHPAQATGASAAPPASATATSGSEAGATATGGGGGRQASVRSRIALRMSWRGSALRTSGTASKLCSGGGERANHSSVAPPQGSCPTSTPR